MQEINSKADIPEKKQETPGKQNLNATPQQQAEQIPDTPKPENSKQQQKNQTKEPEKMVEQLPQKSTVISKVYLYGSAESDQFFIDEDTFESKRPVEIDFFPQNNITIIKLSCGGLHTLALSNQGHLYSWGCNDDWALGRVNESSTGEGNEKIPGRVNLPVPVDMISAGDSHSVAANSSLSLIFQWGTYRNTLQGNMAPPTKEPVRIGEQEFSGKHIKQLLSGSNHTMVLVDKQIYVWGDPQTNVLGRMPLARRKFEQSLDIEGLGMKNVEDVFTAGYHSFIRQKKQNRRTGADEILYFSWGMNNYGQLGIGSLENQITPTEIVELRDKDVINITGGDHHSIALLRDGTVYAWGKNDDGQLALGDDWLEVYQKAKQEADLKEKAQAAQSENEQEEEKQSIQQSSKKQPNSQQKPTTPGKLSDSQEQIDNEVKKVESNVEAGMEILPEEVVEEDPDKNRDYVDFPIQVESLNNIKEIFCGTNYSYAQRIVGDSKEIYSWGFGYNYVLGNGNEDSVTTPFKIKEGFYQNVLPHHFSLGGQHVAFLHVPDFNAHAAQFIIQPGKLMDVPTEFKSRRRTKKQTNDQTDSQGSKQNDTKKDKSVSKSPEQNLVFEAQQRKIEEIQIPKSEQSEKKASSRKTKK